MAFELGIGGNSRRLPWTDFTIKRYRVSLGQDTRYDNVMYSIVMPNRTKYKLSAVH
jgi:hypothetical protein